MKNINDQLVKTFRRFVEIDSPTDFERDFSNFLKKEIEQLGFAVFQDERGNLIVNTDGIGKPLLLSAHIDTVEPGRGIKTVIENNVIKSDGTTILGADNKCAVALIFELLRWISKDNPKIRPLDIIFSVSEEKGITGIDTLDIKKIRAKEGITIDAARPTGTIVLSSPYYWSLAIEIIGKSSHASRSDGISAIPALGKFLNDLYKNIEENEDISFNIGIIQGGTATNSILGNIRINAEIRSFDYKNGLNLVNFVESTLKKTITSKGCSFSFQNTLENDGYVFNKEDVHIPEIARAFEKVGIKAQYLTKARGLADANNLNRLGIKTVDLGYGAEDIHTVNERIAVKDVEKMWDFFKKLCLWRTR